LPAPLRNLVFWISRDTMEPLVFLCEGMGRRNFRRYTAPQNISDVQTAPKTPSKVQQILALAKARGV